MAGYFCGNSKHSDWFIVGCNFAIEMNSMEMVISHVFLLLKTGKLTINKFGPSAIQ